MPPRIPDIPISFIFSFTTLRHFQLGSLRRSRTGSTHFASIPGGSSPPTKSPYLMASPGAELSSVVQHMPAGLTHRFGWERPYPEVARTVTGIADVVAQETQR